MSQNTNQPPLTNGPRSVVISTPTKKGMFFLTQGFSSVMRGESTHQGVYYKRHFRVCEASEIMQAQLAKRGLTPSDPVTITYTECENKVWLLNNSHGLNESYEADSPAAITLLKNFGLTGVEVLR